MTAEYMEYILKQATEGQPVYANLYMSLNTVENVAKAIEFCIEKGKSGVLHLTSHDFMAMGEIIGNFGENVTYTAEKLTADVYCKLLGYDDPNLLQIADDGNFHLQLSCIDTDIAHKFDISCKDVIASVRR
jgi:hypothetical protein